jgi:hypothetical protein
MMFLISLENHAPFKAARFWLALPSLHGQERLCHGYQ